jgi:hypothetical protein
MSNALGDWKSHSGRDREQDRQVDKCWEAIVDGTRETRLGIGVGRCSIELVDCISCDCVNDFKAALANAVNGATETKKHLKEFGGMSIFPATLPLILWDNKPTISASQA